MSVICTFIPRRVLAFLARHGHDPAAFKHGLALHLPRCTSALLGRHIPAAELRFLFAHQAGMLRALVAHQPPTVRSYLVHNLPGASSVILATAKSTGFFQNPHFLDILYIVAFALFIYGMSGLTGPRTAVRGNRIAALGMLIAVVATLLSRSEGNWALIVIGVGIGTLVGVPAARRVRMTAMPQMVALFNGVGGGAVFLIAWAEFRNTGGYVNTPTYVALFSLFAAIVGSISFWGSNIAFGKLQEILPGRPITLGKSQQLVNLGGPPTYVAVFSIFAA
ncbi:MAG TPA: NAD(P)(+) transhydrogenase (Re/Si-specific) subunit beta, partial [Gaiellaceae bacterium]|nr:NAD(P)(+) transhydrogenase (Re/Si-specific) subunit beta [Gaiellaceae bacterium]